MLWIIAALVLTVVVCIVLSSCSTIFSDSCVGMDYEDDDRDYHTRTIMVGSVPIVERVYDDEDEPII